MNNEMNHTLLAPVHHRYAVPSLLPTTSRQQRTHFGLAAAAAGFETISLAEMDSVALLDRIDTKFVLPVEAMLRVLNGLRADYRNLCVEGQRLIHYRTLYFDTPAFDLYTRHVNGRADRYKVRSREYVDSHTAFLEVKHRTGKDRTVKSRIATAEPLVWVGGRAQRWLRQVYPFDTRSLEPKLWNTFTRVTLVNRQMGERVTVDFDLAFTRGDESARLDGIAVAEVKSDGRDRVSPFLAAMREERARPQSFSKYVIGASLLYGGVKKNRVKAGMLRLEKISNGVHHD